MVATADIHRTFAVSLPSLHVFPVKLECSTSQQLADTIYAVAFCPYTGHDEEPVFAFTVQRETVVCRLNSDKDDSIEVLRWFQDEDTETSLNSLTWAQDSDTEDLLLCVCGEKPRKIFVLNVTQGRLEKTLVGHGGATDISRTPNGLAVSPLSPSILASASADHTVRLWDLSCPDETKAFKVLLAGGGHRYEVTCLAFHRNGRYLLSGGLDTCINLWLVPDLTHSNYPKQEEDLTIDHGVQILDQSHFSTCEVHGDHIDCIDFHTDLILSKSYREPFILLWRITGFSSKTSLPARSSAPTTSDPMHKTRSAFSEDNTNAFQVLLRFAMPNCANSWTHFGLFHPFSLHSHPILLVGSDNLWISLWDLRALEHNILGDVELERMPSPGKAVPLLPSTSEERTKVRKGGLEGPFKEMLPHKAIRVPNLGKVDEAQALKHFSFTRDGGWCVAVGEFGLVALLKWERGKEELGRAMDEKTGG